MRIRERGNIWPVISVAAGAFFVLVVMPLILHRQNSGRMATVDPQVTIGDAVSDTTAASNSPAYRWPDSAVPRSMESRQVDGISVPNAFAPIPEIIAAGWQPRLFKQTQIPDDERAQLEQWAKNITQK